MHERCITEEEVEYVIVGGTIIERYAPLKRPANWTCRKKAIHIVYADEVEDSIRIIITVYEPDPNIWHDDLKTRR